MTSLLYSVTPQPCQPEPVHMNFPILVQVYACMRSLYYNHIIFLFPALGRHKNCLCMTLSALHMLLLICTISILVYYVYSGVIIFMDLWQTMCRVIVKMLSRMYLTWAGAFFQILNSLYPLDHAVIIIIIDHKTLVYIILL